MSYFVREFEQDDETAGDWLERVLEQSVGRGLRIRSIFYLQYRK